MFVTHRKIKIVEENGKRIKYQKYEEYCNH